MLDIAESVVRSEPANGATVRLVYSERAMKFFLVTESELKQIGLANMAITGSAAVGSALLAFGIDIYKDTVLSDQIPTTAIQVIEVVQPLCLIGGLAFWAMAGALCFWRWSMVRMIKQEGRARS